MNLIDAIVYRYRRWRYPDKPLPRIGSRAGAMVPGWLIRLGAVCCTSLCLWLATSHTGGPALGVKVALMVLCLVLLAWPDYRFALAAIVVAAGFMLSAGPLPFNPAAPWIALTGYAGFRLANVAALLPWAGKAQLKAIWSWRDLVVVAVAAGLQFVLLFPGGTGSWTVWLGTAGMIMVALVCFIVRPKD